MNREKFGVVAVQAQAGAENAMGGMAQAYADNVPILVMLGGVTLNQIGVKPNFTAVEKYRGFAKQIEAVYGAFLHIETRRSLLIFCGQTKTF